ncbi:phosphotransferase family protein [Mycoplasmopsis felifaucium]|uniref:Phosphotransferase n=1 Tax=Mycoplasmopsis felifaucium TaxID=35768 RepID=A0ABZ2RPC1_9BACT
MDKKYIKIGFTNISYLQDGYFYQEKKYTGFNHKLDYSLLSQFSFVPKLLSNSEKIAKWEYIEGTEPKMTDENLIQIARYLKELHKSKLPFPPSNHARRVKVYRSILRSKNINIQALNDFYDHVNATLSKMDKTKPLHNDLWPRNMVCDINNKIYICDWEYATLGDINFELAYFIESAQLTDEQESTFLKEYDDYSYLFVLRHKILVNYLVILWAHSQEKLPFKTDFYEKRLYELDAQLKKYKES